MTNDLLHWKIRYHFGTLLNNKMMSEPRIKRWKIGAREKE